MTKRVRNERTSFVRSKFLRWFLACSLLIAPACFAETFGWPLQDNYGISATFGENRDDHFHAGIDLSTNGEVGLPVLAIADGQITRLKIQKRAYGKAIYIEHANGISSVYAHLSGYSSALGVQQIYENKVMETGNRYPGDIFLDKPIPVRKGQVVAFSGESGAGFPHLHLEIRRNESLAVNPLMNGFQDTLDPVPPTFQALYLYPLNTTSAVDGDLETEEVRLQKKDAFYTSDHVPVVRGDFMISVSVYDSALRPYHRAPYKVVMTVDDKNIYTVEFDALSYGQPSYFGLLYDLGKPGSSYYEYPMILNKFGNIALPFTAGSIPFSTRDLAAGMHQLQIEAFDTNNNSSIAHLNFVVNDPPSMRVESVVQQEADVIVNAVISDPNWRGNAPQSLAGEVEYSVDDGKSFSTFPATTLQTQSGGQESHFQYRVPLVELQNSKVGRLLLKARAFDGIEYSSYSLLAFNLKTLTAVDMPAILAEGKLRATTYSNSVKIVFDSKSLIAGSIPLNYGTPPAVVALEAQDLTSYQTVLSAPRMNGPWNFSVNGNALSIPVHYMTTGSASRVTGDNFELLFDPDTLLWDTFIWTKSLPAYTARYLPQIGPILQIGPRGLPFKKDAALIFHYPQNFPHPEKLSVYGWSRTRQRWASLPSTVDPATLGVATKISFLDLYALIYDNVPPVISPIFPKRKSVTRNPAPKLAVQIQDSGMDVDDEKIAFYMDGKEYKPEYDPDRNLATLQIETPLRKGYHQFWVIAYDYGNNKTVSPKIKFRVR